MKMKNLTGCLAAVAVAAIIFTGCQKEVSQPLTQNGAGSDMATAEIAVLADQADNDFMNAGITGGTETEAFALNNDGLPDAYNVSETSADGIMGTKRSDDDLGITRCLHNLDLSTEQVAKIRVLFHDYEKCKYGIVMRYHNASKDLLIKYNNYREELVKALRSGKITKTQFEEKMIALRKAYNAERDELASKVRTALKDCYYHMLRGLNGILTDKQWKAFVACYQH